MNKPLINNTVEQQLGAAYRPDIDGLRAIAVWVVVFFHLGYSWMPGGFVGVDVFFVISGFLITNLLAKQVGDAGFSYKQFYVRRFRRLLPAYLFLAFVSLLWAVFYLLPEDFIFHSRMLGLALLSLGNFYIANKTLGYFAVEAEAIPLLHTWSLAVEEQFYLIWPILVLLICRYVAKRFLPYLMLLLVAGLLYVSEWYIDYDAVRAYFLLPARAFELLMGAAFALSIEQVKKPSALLASIMSFIGLLLILASAAMLSKASRFPGVNALWPCLGSLMLIYAGQVANPISRVLAAKPVVFLGLLSYSFYLWHWFVISAMHYRFGEFDELMRIVALLVSFAAAFLSWRFVEQPFRFGFKWSFAKTCVILLLVPFLLFAAVALLADKTNGLPERFGEKQQAVAAISNDIDAITADCQREAPGQYCAQVLAIGDSHNIHFQSMLNEFAKDKGLSFSAVSKKGCQPFLGSYTVNVSVEPEAVYEACFEHYQQTYAGINEAQRFVILSGFWVVQHTRPEIFYSQSSVVPVDRGANDAAIASGLRNAIEKILSVGAVPVLVQDNPAIEATHCIKQWLFGTIAPGQCVQDIAYSTEVQAKTRAIIENIASEYPQVIVIDPWPVMCDEQHCRIISAEMALYTDTNHLSARGAQLIGQQYLQQLGNPLEINE